MSSTLYWYKPQGGEPLCYAFKTAIKEMYNSGDITLRDGDIGFLRGLEIAGEGTDLARDCKIIISAIVKYGEITLREEF